MADCERHVYTLSSMWSYWRVFVLVCLLTVYLLTRNSDLLQTSLDPLQTSLDPLQTGLDPVSSGLSAPGTDGDSVQLRRLQTLEDGCTQMGLHPINSSDLGAEILNGRPYFLFQQDYGVGLKSPGKTGCTSWKLALLNSTGQLRLEEISAGEKLHWVHLLASQQDGPLASAKHLPPAQVAHALAHSYTILTVRHPLDRLESAYTDKVLVKYHKRVEILSKRPGMTKAKLNQLLPDGHNIPFEEFLNFTITKIDEHWTDVFTLTTPCSVSYRFIGKMETISRDLNTIIHLKFSGQGKVLHLNHMREDQPPSHPDDQPLHDRNVGVLLPLFSALGKTKTYWINKMAAVYKKDFQLFGYDYRLQADGKVYATCKAYDSRGMCI